MKNNMVSIEVTNDETGDDEIAHYSYLVRIAGKVVREGRVENHVRSSGWEGLLMLIGFQEVKRKSKRDTNERRRT
jgi:hypothetical protein